MKPLLFLLLWTLCFEKSEALSVEAAAWLPLWGPKNPKSSESRSPKDESETTSGALNRGLWCTASASAAYLYRLAEASGGVGLSLD